MSEEIKGIKKNVRELYDARNNHETRLSVVETNISFIKEEQTEIKQDIKDNHTEYMGAVGMIQNTIDGFIKDINGIPKKNKEAIEDLKTDFSETKTDVKGINKTVIQWGAVIAFIGFLVMAWLAYKQINGTEKPEVTKNEEEIVGD